MSAQTMPGQRWEAIRATSSRPSPPRAAVGPASFSARTWIPSGRLMGSGSSSKTESCGRKGLPCWERTAAILEGCRSVIESGEPHGQIQVVILVAEEVGLLGSKALDMSLVSSDLGYVFDSGQPVGHLVSEAPTHDSLMVEFTGRAAHAGVCPEEGASAIVAASRAVSRMPLGRVDFETTANVGVISGGTARNIIPEKCEIKAEARSRDTGKLDRQVAAMREALEGAARETDCDVKIEVTREYLGYKHSRDIPLMELALRAADSLGMAPALVPHGGGSDCNILNAKGLPTAVIGVGYEKIHTPAEYIALSDLKRCAEYVAAIVRASGDA